VEAGLAGDVPCCGALEQAPSMATDPHSAAIKNL
jgi:hypothetical protein